MSRDEATGGSTIRGVVTDCLAGVVSVAGACLLFWVLGSELERAYQFDRDGEIGYGIVAAVDEERYSSRGRQHTRYSLQVTCKHGRLVFSSTEPFTVGTRVRYIYSPSLGKAELVPEHLRRGELLSDRILSPTSVVIGGSAILVLLGGFLCLRDAYIALAKKTKGGEDAAFERLSKNKRWLELGTTTLSGSDAEIPPGLNQRQAPDRSSDSTQGGLPVSQRPETTARRSGQQPQQDKGRMARTQRSDMPVGRRGEGAQQSNCLRMPSRFDELRDSSHAISWRLWKYRIVPVLVVVVGSVFLGESLGGGVVALVGFFVAAFAARTIVDAILKAVSVRFTSLCSTLSQIETEIARLRKAMQRLMAAHPTRRKHDQFKVTFNIKGRTISDLEKVLAIGMHKERKEVYVTAFIRDGVAVRVTAAIGSARSCRGADDKNLWREHIQRLRCDEIRHYHNHPDYSNRTTPSP